MRYTLGENWSDYFDLVISYCEKPIFFTENQKMYTIDKNSSDLRGQSIS